QRENVPELVVLAILLEQAGMQRSLSDLTLAPFQIGRTFALSQQALFDLFQRVRAFASAWCPTVERIGRHLWVTIPAVAPRDVLSCYYSLHAR
ncbi:MAG TPA: hypothetical protein VF458_03915, partial [Ktedonobacteraceae bacterium]